MTELKQCMFCSSTDGAHNEVCNYHYMVFQNSEELNNYIKKFNECEEAKSKLLKIGEENDRI